MNTGSYNPAAMAAVLKSLWPTQDGSVCAELDKIVKRNGKYDSQEALVEDAKYIYEHIEENAPSSIGKGLFAQVLSENISEDFIIPQYIIDAILWACGGIQHDQT